MARQSSETPAPETLYAAALYLATTYAKTGCPMVCRMLVRQMDYILSYPEPLVPPVLRDICCRLRADWERIGSERMRVLQAAEIADVEPASRVLH